MLGKIRVVGTVGMLIGLTALTVQDAEARGGRGGGGGGFRGGGMSMSRGGSGGFSNSGTFSRGGGSYSRPSGSYSRPSGGYDRGSGVGGASRPGQGGSGTQRPSQLPSRPGQGGGGNNINSGNTFNRNTNINIDNDNNWGGWRDHPIAAGIAIGAVAGMTAAAIGSAYYALPAGCSPYPLYTYTYYSCGSAWYQPQYEGDTVVYVTVPDPASGPPPPQQ